MSKLAPARMIDDIFGCRKFQFEVIQLKSRDLIPTQWKRELICIKVVVLGSVMIAENSMRASVGVALAHSDQNLTDAVLGRRFRNLGFELVKSRRARVVIQRDLSLALSDMSYLG